MLPASIGRSPSINISGPNGVQEIANPLYSYRFKPFNSSIFIMPPVSTRHAEEAVVSLTPLIVE